MFKYFFEDNLNTLSKFNNFEFIYLKNKII